MIVPVVAAAFSPLLAWRRPVYIVAGFAGIVGMILLLLQPLLIARALPGLEGRRGRTVHRVAGRVLVLTVAVHVAGLWMTSPPDVIDALLLRSPTPFSLWGVIAMWALLLAAGLAALRRKTGRWRRGHRALAAVVVATSVLHALLIDGTMEPVSRAVLCGLAVVATFFAVSGVRLKAR